MQRRGAPPGQVGPLIHGFLAGEVLLLVFFLSLAKELKTQFKSFWNGCMTPLLSHSKMSLLHMPLQPLRLSLPALITLHRNCLLVCVPHRTMELPEGKDLASLIPSKMPGTQQIVNIC